MTQRKRFLWPVHKDVSTDIIGVGDGVVLVLKTGFGTSEQVTGADPQGYWIEWDSSVNQVRQEDVRGVAGNHNGRCNYEGVPDGGPWLLDANGNPILDANGNPIPSL